MAAFDYKKEYKQLYQPKKEPELIQVPPMQFVAVEGKGDPNEENGAYSNALSLLYGISFTIKMSHLGSKKSRDIFLMWYRRWKGFGGWRMELPALITAGNPSFAGFR